MSGRAFRFGLVSTGRSADWPRLAGRAEQLGFDTLLVPENVTGGLAPLPALAAAAAATSELRLGTFVLPAGLHNPSVLAWEAATVDRLCGGRLELGIGAGAGPEPFLRTGIPFGTPGQRVEQVRQLVTALRAEWVRDGWPAPARTPPVLIGAGGRAMLTVAAEHADIVAIANDRELTTEAVTGRTGLLRDAAGARADEIELALTLQCVLAEGETPPGHVAQRLHDMFDTTVSDLIAADSPFVLAGSVEHRCEQLLRLREDTGVSYLAVGEDAVDALAPVVARLRDP